jgi:uncharacterized iron-regulated membrane protein
VIRRIGVVAHRWMGLFTAAFLFVAGTTGAIIAWDHELDAVINPEFTWSATPGPAQSPLALAEALEARDPRIRVTWLPLVLSPGHALTVGVAPGLPYDEVALDPVTGAVQGERKVGAASFDSLLSFLYDVHYRLHLPMVWDVDTGLLFMGLVAVVWLVDSFVALAVSFPSRSSWRRSFVFRWRAGPPKLLFDLHRSSGVWLWLVLVVFATTAVSMNLGDTVVRPLLGCVFPLAEDAWELRDPAREPVAPAYDRRRIVALAAWDAEARGWDPPGGVYYGEHHGIYAVGFWRPGEEHGDGTLGKPWLHYDATTGEHVGDGWIPGEGSPGDLFLHAQLPLHSGRWFGLPGRIAVSTLGIAVATLSATGVWLWIRRQLRQRRP